MTTLKNRPDEKTDELENYKGKWRNLYIFENGKEFGWCLFETEEAARKAAEQYVGFTKRFPIMANRDWHIGTSGKIFVNLKTVFQVPVDA